MAWALLVLAGVLEVGWAIGLKYTEGFTRPVPGGTMGSIVQNLASAFLEDPDISATAYGTPRPFKDDGIPAGTKCR